MRKLMSITAIAAVAVVAIAGAIVWAARSASASGLGKVDGVTIDEDEVHMYAQICSSQPCSSVHSISADSSEHDKRAFVQAMVDTMAEDKALLILARDNGFGDATTYETFEAARERTNTEKSEQAKAGKTVYGVTSYADASFRSRILEQADSYLKQQLGKSGGELYVSDDEAKQYFAANRESWNSKPVVTVLHVTFPTSSQEQVNTALASLTTHLQDAEAYFSSLAVGVRSSSITIDPNATVSPELQDLADAVSGLDVGQTTPIHADGEDCDFYIVTQIEDSDEQADWQRYEARVTEQLQSEKLDRLVEQTKAQYETDVDIGKLVQLIS